MVTCVECSAGVPPAVARAFLRCTQDRRCPRAGAGRSPHSGRDARSTPSAHSHFTYRSPPYSYRKATMGSSRLARRAGRYPAAQATSASAATAKASVDGSCADKP